MKPHATSTTIPPSQTTGITSTAKGSSAADQAEELDLIRRIAVGDRQAFETLYRRYTPRLVAYLLPLLGQDPLVDEVRNDVMLVVWQRAGEFRPTAQLSTWIFGIARHKALKARAQRARQFVDFPAAASAARDQDNPERHLIRQERARAVVQALAALPPHLREVVEGHYYQARSYLELAAHLGCSVPTVKTRMSQARRRLAVRLVRERRQPCPGETVDHSASTTGPRHTVSIRHLARRSARMYGRQQPGVPAAIGVMPSSA